MIDLLTKICVFVTAAGGAIVFLHKGYRFLFPLKASIEYTLKFDGVGRDSLSVNVTNLSSASVYLRSCSVRCTYPFWCLVYKHIRRPFLSPRLYPTLRYNGAVVYELVDGNPIKIEPNQLLKLTSEIHEHPLNALHGPMLIARVELTNDKVFFSERLPSPRVWRFVGLRNRITSV